jgi:hypothetical protein
LGSVSEVSVHDQLAIFITLDIRLCKTKWWLGHIEEEAFHFMAPRKQKDREAWEKIQPPRTHALTHFLNIGP